MVSKAAGFGGVEDRRLTLAGGVGRATHGGRGVGGHDLAGDEPVEEVAHGGELLLDRRCGERAALQLNPGRDVEGLDGRELVRAGCLAPDQKVVDRAGVGAAGVRVADRGGEELQVAPCRPLAGSGGEGRDDADRRRWGQHARH
jgi:hypothetical protein